MTSPSAAECAAGAAGGGRRAVSEDRFCIPHELRKSSTLPRPRPNRPLPALCPAAGWCSRPVPRLSARTRRAVPATARPAGLSRLSPVWMAKCTSASRTSVCRWAEKHSVCRGGAAEGRHGRERLPDGVLDCALLLLPVGHADLTLLQPPPALSQGAPQAPHSCPDFFLLL
ncbi:hypothetical protein Q9966_001779 [Columba livia]|nr:hypothetical protein Q9966_001779 [Columba livia]